MPSPSFFLSIIEKTKVSFVNIIFSWNLVAGFLLTLAGWVKISSYEIRGHGDWSVSYDSFIFLFSIFELGFGLLLLLGFKSRLFWFITVALFSIFTIINILAVLNGYKKCGCFGYLSPPVWLTLIIDVLLIIQLLISKKLCLKQENDNKLTKSQKINTFIFVLFFIVFTVSFSSFDFGQTISEFYEAKEILFEKHVEFQNIISGENNGREIVLKNISNNDVTIVGTKSCCGASIPLGLPCSISQNGKITIPLAFKFRSQGPKIQTGDVTIYISSSNSKQTYPITIFFDVLFCNYLASLKGDSDECSQKCY